MQQVIQKSLISLLLFAILLVVADFSLSWVTARRYPNSVFLLEHADETIHFDPVLGMRLTSIPSRWTRITAGSPEWVGVLKGNNAGLSDRDDFQQKFTKGLPRWAVFGDSFTSAQYLSKNWADEFEDLKERSVELYNFAVDGTGVSNWTQTLHHILKHRKYQLNGVIFAVSPGDLIRRFIVSDCRGQTALALGPVPHWDPTQYPRSAAEARQFLRPEKYTKIVGTDEFEASLEGSRPELPPEPFRWVMLSQFDEIQRKFRRFFGWIPPGASYGPEPMFPQGAEQRIDDIKTLLSEYRLPSIVVHMPSREELLDHTTQSRWYRLQAVEFSRRIGAVYVDGTTAFHGLNEADIRKHWFPTDGHWNQAGSSRFARFLADVLFSRSAL